MLLVGEAVGTKVAPKLLVGTTASDKAIGWHQESNTKLGLWLA